MLKSEKNTKYKGPLWAGPPTVLLWVINMEVLVASQVDCGSDMHWEAAFNSISEIVLLHWEPSHFPKSCRVATISCRPSWKPFGLGILYGVAFWSPLNPLLLHFEKRHNILQKLPARRRNSSHGTCISLFCWDCKPGSCKQAPFFLLFNCMQTSIVEETRIHANFLAWKNTGGQETWKQCSLLILPHFEQMLCPFPIFSYTKAPPSGHTFTFEKCGKSEQPKYLGMGSVSLWWFSFRHTHLAGGYSAHPWHKASLPPGQAHLVGCPLRHISELLVTQMADTQTKEGGTDPSSRQTCYHGNGQFRWVLSSCMHSLC